MNDWTEWSDAAHIAIEDVQNGPKFSLYSLAVEEAKAGAGALMGHMCLVEDLVAAGELAQLSDKFSGTGKALILELPKPDQRRPETDLIAQMLP